MTRLADLIDRRPRLVLAILLVLALTLRLGWTMTRPVDADAIDRLPDQREYLDLGRSLLNTGSLAMGDPRFNDVARAFRMPGYPAFIAACGGNVRVVLIVQAILDTATVLATFCLARRWLSVRLALLAGLIVAVDPIHISMTGLVLSETLFAAMLTWGMACLVRGFSPLSASTLRPRFVWLLGVLSLIAAIYVRPSAIVYPTILVFAATLAEVRSLDFLPSRRHVPIVACVIVATFLALLPWAIRNQAAVGRLLFTTTNDGFTLYDGWNPDANGSSDQRWIGQLPLLPNLNEVQRSDYLRTLAIDYAGQHPMRVLALVPAKLARTWSPWPLSTEYGSRRNVILAATHAIPLFVLALVGLFNARLPRTVRLFLIMLAILISIMHGLSVGSLRYRMPAEATLAVLAAAAFHARGRTHEEPMDAKMSDAL